MKFLIQIPRLIYAGAEKVLVDFANCLVSQGNEVEILEIYETGLLKPDFDSRVVFSSICSKAYTAKYYASLAEIRAEKRIGKKLLKCLKQLFSKLAGYRRFAEILAARRYRGRFFDAAINFLETEPPSFLLKKVKAGKYLQWVHIDVSGGGQVAGLADYGKMDGIICVSEYAKEAFCHCYPSLAGKVWTLYNFYNPEKIRQRAGEVSPYGPGLHLLSVGRLTRQKAYPRAVKVLSRLAREGYGFTWHIFGAGPEEDVLREAVEQSGMTGRVLLCGLTDNPYPWMKFCDLFFLPSLYEGFPTVTIEAKLLGCPVLATQVSGIREQLTHGRTGWIVENSEEGLYEGLKRLLDDPALRRSLSVSEGMEKIMNNGEKYALFLQMLKG